MSLSGPLLVVGSVNVDLILQVVQHPKPGETVLAHGGKRSPGGKGANQAVAAARVGCDVSFLGAVGNDGNANFGVQLLTEAGVSLDLLQHADAPTGLAMITLDSHGENSIVVLPGANAELVLDARSVQAIVEAPVVLTQGELDADIIAEVARAAQGRFVLNLAPFLELPLSVLTRANPLIVNEHEAQLVSAQLAASIGPSVTPEETAALLLHQGVPSVVITLGARGALVADADGRTRVPAVHTEVVDTTGAGDAFAGVLAAGLASGQLLSVAAQYASRAAAFSVHGLGAQPSYPWSSDLIL